MMSHPLSDTAGHSLDTNGPSVLHGSRARGLREQSSVLRSKLLHPPPSHTAMRRYADFKQLQPAALFADDEPIVAGHVGDNWRAATRWSSPMSLCQHYGDLRFRVAAGLELSLTEYLEYTQQTEADFPYYIVETSFTAERAELLDDYVEPPIFKRDLLGIVPGTSSSPHWFLGGPRTGSAMHIDPRSTFGWNACMFGCKRWCMFAPNAQLQSLDLGGETAAEGGPCAWFVENIDKLRQAAAAPGSTLRMRECVQNPGELVYVPCGWLHCVINIDCSLAIAHTLVNTDSLIHGQSWARLRSSFPAFAAGLHEMLQSIKPNVAAKLSISTPNQLGYSSAKQLVPCSAQKRIKLPSVQWTKVQAAASGTAKRVLFVDIEWLANLLVHRPDTTSLVNNGSEEMVSGLQSLWAFHEQMQALSLFVRERGSTSKGRSDCMLCLLRRGESQMTLVSNVETKCKQALTFHGLHISAVLEDNKSAMLTWATTQGAVEIAVLRNSPVSSSFQAAVHLALADSLLTARPARSGSAPGIAPDIELTLMNVSWPSHKKAFAAVRGDILLQRPLCECLTSIDASASVLMKMRAEARCKGRHPEDLDLGRQALLVALLELRREYWKPGQQQLAQDASAAENQQSGRHRLAHYIQSLCSPESLAARHMYLWDPESTAAACVAQSVSWQRSQASRYRVSRIRERLIALGAPRMHLDQYLWAYAVVQAHAVSLHLSGKWADYGGGFAVCPGIELAGHLTTGATAEIKVTEIQGKSAAGHTSVEVQLVARFSLKSGDPVTRCYECDDPVCDYLDIFERYGFYPTDSTVHTCEVLVNLADIMGGPGTDEQIEWRRQLVGAEAMMGCDPEFNAWWVPDEALDRCPLFAAVRARFISVAEIFNSIYCPREDSSNLDTISEECEECEVVTPDLETDEDSTDKGLTMQLPRQPEPSIESPGTDSWIMIALQDEQTLTRCRQRLRQPIECEQQVRECMAKILRRHVSRYDKVHSPTAASDSQERLAIAQQLASFEKHLLLAHIRALEKKSN